MAIWKDIRVSAEWIGDEVDKSTSYLSKVFTYIKIPDGYGYDNYCFLLSSRCVHSNLKLKSDSLYISICFNMKIELFYDPEKRAGKKKYKRYKLSGEELYEQVFKDYEVDFIKESEERLKREREEKEKRDRKNIGKVICGLYQGNYYPDNDLKYMQDLVPKAYFIGDKNSTYCNHKFDKVQNVKKLFVIFEGISKYHFGEYEAIINEYLNDYYMWQNMYERLCQRESEKKTIVVNTEHLIHEPKELCERAMNEVLEMLQERIEKLLENDMRSI